MALRIITPPPVEPVTLEEAKAHLRVVDHDDDALIQAYIQASRQAIEGPEGFTGRAFVQQTWELVIDEFPANEIQIPMPPLQEVVSIKYDDSAGVEQTLATNQYFVDTASEPGWVVPVTSGWPTPLEAINAVRIRFTAGYPTDTGVSPIDYTSDIPQNIKQAMLLQIGSLYEHREQNVVGVSVAQLSWGVEALLRPSRVLLGMA